MIGSIIAAVLVGITYTGGITAFLPLMQVLLNNQTVRGWADVQVAERRLNINIADESPDLNVLKVNDGPGNDAGMVPGMPLRRALGQLADPNLSSAVLPDGQSINLPPVPLYMRVIQRIAGFFPERPIYAIATAFGLLALITTVGNTVRFFQEYLSERSAVLAVNDIRRTLYDHVLHIPLAYFGRFGTSDVTSRLVQDCHELQSGMRMVLGPTVQEPIKAAFAFGLAMFFSWKLTLFIALFAPLLFWLIKTFGKKMRRASRKALQQSSALLGQIEGTLNGIRVVKSHSAERFERRRFTGILDGLVRHQLKMTRIDAISSPVMETLMLAVIGAVVLFASYLVLEKGTLDKTSFVMVMIGLGGLGDSLRRVSKVNNVVQKANAAATRVFEVIDRPAERRQPRAAEGSPSASVAPGPRKRLPTIAREVRFQDVRFFYPDATSPAVDGVSLVVPRGSSVAVVGRNGSGKTTLVAMLPRFYDPESGRVMIDGTDVREVSLVSLREQIGIVTQDAVIFPGTIAENIAYGHPLAGKLSSMDPHDVAVVEPLRLKIRQAAEQAFAHEFITAKGQGYDTVLDGLGGQLSGGQKQRLNIARAIFRASPILILDEATSQVDAESEHLIQQAIESLMHDRTTFVIAHRFSTILSADSIVVMEQGKIVGRGRHSELMKTCPVYAQLYERQLGPAAMGDRDEAAAPSGVVESARGGRSMDGGEAPDGIDAGDSSAGAKHSEDSETHPSSDVGR